MASAVFKFNNGNSALLCSTCRTILKTGRDFNKEEKQAIRGEIYLEAKHCEECGKK